MGSVMCLLAGVAIGAGLLLGLELARVAVGPISEVERQELERDPVMRWILEVRR